MILLNKYEILEQEIYDNNISLYEYPLNQIDAFCTKVDTKDYICVNNTKDYSKLEKYWIIEHELEHVKTRSYYTVNSSRQVLLRKERKANDSLIEKFNLASSTFELLAQGLEKWEICELLEITQELYEHIVNYIKRKMKCTYE